MALTFILRIPHGLPAWPSGTVQSVKDVPANQLITITEAPQKQPTNSANVKSPAKYHPTNEHPQLIFFADFDGSGKAQIVEAKSTESALLPVRGRSCSSNAMPVLRERSASFHSFASATLEDISRPQARTSTILPTNL
jgi:hypothetical protein